VQREINIAVRCSHGALSPCWRDGRLDRARRLQHSVSIPWLPVSQRWAKKSTRFTHGCSHGAQSPCPARSTPRPSEAATAKFQSCHYTTVNSPRQNRCSGLRKTLQRGAFEIEDEGIESPRCFFNVHTSTNSLCDLPPFPPSPYWFALAHSQRSPAVPRRLHRASGAA
jgi:hypothetical protein